MGAGQYWNQGSEDHEVIQGQAGCPYALVYGLHNGSPVAVRVASDGTVSVNPSVNRANRAYAEINITDTSVHTLLPAQSGEYADILQITFANTSGTGTEVALSDGNQTIPIYCPANFTFGFVNPDFFDQIAPNAAWTLQCVTGVTTLKVFAKFQLSTS